MINKKTNQEINLLATMHFQWDIALSASAGEEIWKKLQKFELLSFLLAQPSVGGICFHFTSVQIPFPSSTSLQMGCIACSWHWSSSVPENCRSLNVVCVRAGERVSEWVARINDTHIDSKRIFAPSKALPCNKWKVCQLKYIRAVKSQRRKREQKNLSLAHSPRSCAAGKWLLHYIKKRLGPHQR